MNWKFWEKEGTAGAVKQSRPKELPANVGRHLVVDLKKDPDWVWSLRYVSRPMPDSATRVEIRIFDPASADEKDVIVKSFDALDAHPELILYQGWNDKQNNTHRVGPPVILKGAA